MISRKNLHTAPSQLAIDSLNGWLKVESAFGGMAIYKRNALLASNSQYIGLNQEGLEVAEHVSLHLDMTQRKYKIFINPSLINTDYTEHSIRFKVNGKKLLYV
jgi:hypothetical protein